LISDPYLARLVVTNLGPYDLTPAVFEGGYLRLVSGMSTGGAGSGRQTGALFALLEADLTGKVDYRRSQGEPQISVELDSFLLKVGESATLAVLVSGRPDFSLE